MKVCIVQNAVASNTTTECDCCGASLEKDPRHYRSVFTLEALKALVFDRELIRVPLWTLCDPCNDKQDDALLLCMTFVYLGCFA